jgi:hypothetical protein
LNLEILSAGVDEINFLWSIFCSDRLTYQNPKKAIDEQEQMPARDLYA